jgi:hypothetical protein
MLIYNLVNILILEEGPLLNYQHIIKIKSVALM